jgi:hypothetical protein
MCICMWCMRQTSLVITQALNQYVGYASYFSCSILLQIANFALRDKEVAPAEVGIVKSKFNGVKR